MTIKPEAAISRKCSANAMINTNMREAGAAPPMERQELPAVDPGQFQSVDFRQWIVVLRTVELKDPF